MGTGDNMPEQSMLFNRFVVDRGNNGVNERDNADVSVNKGDRRRAVRLNMLHGEDCAPNLALSLSAGQHYFSLNPSGRR